MTEHIVCPAGEYQSDTGQINCAECPAGSECSDPTSAPVPCDPGFYSEAKSINCSQCPTGKAVTHVNYLLFGSCSIPIADILEKEVVILLYKTNHILL